MLENKFQAMGRAAARRHFEEYVARADDGLQRLRTQCNVDLDCSPESMTALWAWFLGRAEALEEPRPFDDAARLPAWVDVDDPFLQRLTVATLWMADGLAYYLAACLQAAVPGARWEMGDEPRVKSYFFQNQPLLTGFTSDASPLGLVLQLVGDAVVWGRGDPAQLNELVAAVLAEARS